MDEKANKRPRFILGGQRRRFRRDKDRSTSLDLTHKTAISTSSQHSFEATSNSRGFLERQGPLSRATSLLFWLRRGSPPTEEEQDPPTFNSIKAEKVTLSPTLPPKAPQTPATPVARDNAPLFVTESDEEVLEEFTNHRQDPAMRARREAIRAQQKLYGEDHPDVLFSMQCLAQVHYNRGEHKEAQLVLDEVHLLSRRDPEQQGGDGNLAVPRNILTIN